MFDIIFCYFPITFKPPPDDPYGITPSDLKISLRSCMAANPRFAPLAMPLFLEKLGPSLGQSKRDVLQSLAEVIPVYGVTGLEPFLQDLWDGLKTEVSHSCPQCFGPVSRSERDIAFKLTRIFVYRISYRSFTRLTQTSKKTH